MNKCFTTTFLYKHISGSEAEASGEFASYGLWEGLALGVDSLTSPNPHGTMSNLIPLSSYLCLDPYLTA